MDCHYRSHTSLSPLLCMAGTTGLEPATSAVTGQRSNQLSYVPTNFSPTYAKSKNVQAIAAVYLFSRCHVFHGTYPISAMNGQHGQHEILPSMLLQANRNPEHLSMSRVSNCTKQIHLGGNGQGSPTRFEISNRQPSKCRRQSTSETHIRELQIYKVKYSGR